MKLENPESTGAGRTRLYSSAALCRALRAGLRKKADPEIAPGMQAYMKSEMPYLGVRTPALKAVCRQVFAEHPIGTQKRWLDTFLAVWRGAEHREERYAAINLAGLRRLRRFPDA